MKSLRSPLEEKWLVCFERRSALFVTLGGPILFCYCGRAGAWNPSPSEDAHLWDPAVVAVAHHCAVQLLISPALARGPFCLAQFCAKVLRLLCKSFKYIYLSMEGLSAVKNTS